MGRGRRHRQEPGHPGLRATALTLNFFLKRNRMLLMALTGPVTTLDLCFSKDYSGSNVEDDWREIRVITGDQLGSCYFN